jgi:hypothetical protein
LPRNADYTHMRCRYCGKELALLKRLTGGGEFCSDAHKQSYQDEYNRLALSRLLQAQKISQAESVGKKTTPRPAAPVAVADPAPVELRLEEHATNGKVRESAPLEISTLDGSATAEPAAPEAPPEAEVETEAEPLETAPFLVEGPAIATLSIEKPYFEPWLEFTPGPAVANCQIQNESPMLSTGELLSLDLHPNPSPAEHHVAQASFTPQEFANGHSQPSLPRNVDGMHEWPSAGPISIAITPSAVDFAADQSIARELDFETFVVIEDCWLVELPCTGIEFTADDSSVELAFEQDHDRQEDGAAIDSAPLEIEPSPILEDDSPRASLEALSRLHQDLVHREEVQHETESSEAREPETVEAVPVAVADDATLPSEPSADQEEPRAGEPTPGRATELLDIPVRMFPPSKPAPIAGMGLPSHSEPLLPNLKSLPLRPKVAVASGYVPPSITSGQSKATTSAPQAKNKDARTVAPSKVSPAARPAARIAQPKQPATPVKVVSSVKSSEVAPTPAAKAQPPASIAKTAPPSTAEPEARSAKADAAEPASNPGKETAPTGASVKVAGQPAKPVVEETTPKEIAKPGQIAKPAAMQPAKQSLGESDRESVPNFGASQLASPSFAGSLKVKLGIAIVLVIAACSLWLGWGGKSHKPASNGAISADGSGPSIIMGEGGWVEGWGGDPAGVHAGRQITIYRPSLKLSDYRIEFQGSIETQSIGWVFRAADPENYYALKLLTVSSGLSPKVALFKYLVLNGRQTQVGRVPIDLAVQADTVFSIRTDVRGPQFSTYIQGRQVDVWTDDQLKAGGVGFLNEREERGKVKSVSIRYLSGATK